MIDLGIFLRHLSSQIAGEPAASMTLTGWVSRLGILGLVCVLSWAVWHLSAFVRNSLRINRGLIKGKIPGGPSRSEAFTLLKSLDTHRTVLDWVEKYGSIFSTKLLHFHV
jgi:hypothetical protein